MEPAGLALGVVGLAGTFSTCLECFEYIQLGRSFGQDFSKCQLRLDVARLRLKRWGESVGIAKPEELESMPGNSSGYEQQDIVTAGLALGEIQEAFGVLEKRSLRYQKMPGSQAKDGQSSSLAVFDAAKDMNMKEQSLRDTIQGLGSRYHKSNSILRKTKWALYEKRLFDGLIAEISEQVKDLEALFPNTQKKREALCKSEEMPAIKAHDDESLQLLQAASEGSVDNLLKDNLSTELQARGHRVHGFTLGKGAELYVGDNNTGPGLQSFGHDVFNYSTGDKSITRIGNTNHYQGA